MTREKVHRNW